MEQFIKGNWQAGWAIDLHTLSCSKNPDGSFNTTRSDIGELVYRLKYSKDGSTINTLSNMVASFIRTRRIFSYIDVILPVPPSKQRDLQPVSTIAIETGSLVNKKVDLDYIKKLRCTSEVKEIDDPNERAKLLANAFGLKDKRYKGKDILLFDDLYRSGTTLKEITNVLYSQGEVRNVYVVTMTKTRKNR